MFHDRSALSTSEISLLFVICNISAMLAEVPTGALADRIPRRTVLLLSALLTALSFTFWLVLPNFLGYALGFVVWGIGFAMSSGTLQAYLYDELHALGRSDAFTKIFSRGRSMSYAGMFLGYGLAIIIGIERYEWLLALSLVACFLAIVVVLQFPKDRVTTSIAQERGHIRSSLQIVRGSPTLQRIVPTIALIGGSVAIMDDYVPLYYATVRVSLDVIPYLLLAGVFLGIIATWFAHRFEHRQPLWLVAMMLLAGLVLLTSSYGGRDVAVLGMMGFIALMRLAVVLFEASLHHEFVGTSRATLGSLPSFLNEIWGVGMAAVYGVVAHLADDLAAIRAAAITVAVTAVALMAWWACSLRDPIRWQVRPSAAPRATRTPR
jgi:MFS family permease